MDLTTNLKAAQERSIDAEANRRAEVTLARMPAELGIERRVTRTRDTPQFRGAGHRREPRADSRKPRALCLGVRRPDPVLDLVQHVLQVRR